MNIEVPLFSAPGLVGWLWKATWQASITIGVVLILQWALRKRLAPRWRHALWLVVVIRLMLPWSPGSEVSLFNLFAALGAGPTLPSGGEAAAAERGAATGGEEGEAERFQPRVASGWHSAAPWVLWGWLGGVVTLGGYLVCSNWRLARRVRRQRPVTDTRVLEVLEDCKQEMGVSVPLTLVETPAAGSPALLGFVRPRLLLPVGVLRDFSLSELRFLFLHELGHLRRGDVALNWLATVPVLLHWFNPLVWYACHRMRVDGELACDALALSRMPGGETQSYGRTLIKLLESFARPAVGPGLAGILENQNQMKERISMIAKYHTTRSWPLLGAALLGILAVVTLTDAQTPSTAGRGGAAPADGQGPPRIVATSPPVGATDVDPALSEISVTFDRDMAGGFSWTGGGPEYPPIPEGKKPQWKDKRTCVLPVKLERGRFYRVGINSTSYQNFRSAAGVPAQPSAIYFTTQGASDELKARASKPRIVAINPRNNAQDVDPGLTEIRVTFNVPMGGGFSWTGGGPDFPKIPEGRKPYWSEDRKTCALPVQLEPGHTYRLGLNSPSHKNFQSAGGVPLDPVSYSFTTRK